MRQVLALACVVEPLTSTTQVLPHIQIRSMLFFLHGLCTPFFDEFLFPDLTPRKIVTRKRPMMVRKTVSSRNLTLISEEIEAPCERGLFCRKLPTDNPHVIRYSKGASHLPRSIPKFRRCQ